MSVISLQSHAWPLNDTDSHYVRTISRRDEKAAVERVRVEVVCCIRSAVNCRSRKNAWYTCPAEMRLASSTRKTKLVIQHTEDTHCDSNDFRQRADDWGTARSARCDRPRAKHADRLVGARQMPCCCVLAGAARVRSLCTARVTDGGRERMRPTSSRSSYARVCGTQHTRGVLYTGACSEPEHTKPKARTASTQSSSNPSEIEHSTPQRTVRAAQRMWCERANVRRKMGGAYGPFVLVCGAAVQP